MKTWKQCAFVGFLAVVALALVFTACDDGNGNTGNGDPVLCTCVEKAHLEHYDDVCDCNGEDCACIPKVYAWFNETIPVYIMNGVTNQDTALANLNSALTEYGSDDPDLIIKNIQKVIIVPKTNECNINNQENGKYIVEIGETANSGRIGSFVINAIQDAPLITKAIPMNILNNELIV